MSGRPTADIVADLELPSVVRFCASSFAVEQFRKDAVARLTELDAEVTRLMVIATDTQLENEITRALNHVPARCLRDGEPWEEGVRRMREELDEWRSMDPEQRVEQERANRAEVESELRAIDALRPPCPTCGGTMVVRMGDLLHGRMSCPDCVDGKVSIEQLAARWNAAQDEVERLTQAAEMGDLSPSGFDFLTLLRSVKQ